MDLDVSQQHLQSRTWSRLQKGLLLGLWDARKKEDEKKAPPTISLFLGVAPITTMARSKCRPHRRLADPKLITGLQRASCSSHPSPFFSAPIQPACQFYSSGAPLIAPLKYIK